MYTCESQTVKKTWALKNCHFRTVVLEKTLESPLDSKEIKPVNPKGNQPCTVTGRTNAEAEAPILWPPDAKNWLIGKDPVAGKDWRQEEKGMTGGWDGWMASPIQWTWVRANSGRWWRIGKPGMLQSMGLKESDTTEWLNNNSIYQYSVKFSSTVCFQNCFFFWVSQLLPLSLHFLYLASSALIVH